MRSLNHTRLAKTFCSWLLLATILIFCRCAMAQSNTAIPVDDPELYIGALRMVEALHSDAAQSGSSGAAAIDAAIQRDMNITSADFAVLLQEAALTDSLIWKGGKGGQALQGELRNKGVTATRQRLAKSLSPAGWTNFQTFVNGPFRQSSFRGQVQLPTQAR